MSEPFTRQAVAAMIDHTLLRPEATAADVAGMCRVATELRVFAVCVSPTMVRVAVDSVGAGVRVATVCGFPSGAVQGSVKSLEAHRAVSDGAHEIDMVVDLGQVKSADFSAVQAQVADVVAAAGPALVKVIVESAALTDGEIVACCRTAVDAGAGFVKTSTGFHPSGGASSRAVALMRATVGPTIGVKASGGIRTAEHAVAMVQAGASRLGCSASAAILAGLPG